jgi:hypothetical protein
LNFQEFAEHIDVMPPNESKLERLRIPSAIIYSAKGTSAAMRLDDASQAASN